jgi:predicted dehydrogenase
MAMVGCGRMARNHLRRILTQTDTTNIVALCEPSGEALAETAELFAAEGLSVPPNEPDLAKLLAEYKPETVFIVTPHVLHYDQARRCLEAGVDVLMEKPMVMNAEEARDLIGARDATGNLLVVAFNGSLSPRIREASRMLRSGELGRIASISASIWQGWGSATEGKWRQDPKVSGGGFLFDTGAHMMNTVSDLAGEAFSVVAAWTDNNGRPVETRAVVMARLESGAMVTLNGCGETIKTCRSDIRVFCDEGIIRTGAWGEFLELQRQGEAEFSPVDVTDTGAAWDQFLAVRRGELENPSPPEVGLRMALLYDAIKESAAKDGMPVRCGLGTR